MNAVLDGVLVVDITQGVSGPFCTRILSQLGARVIKVERPGHGDLVREWDSIVNGMCSGHAWVNPGKESVALDLSTSSGQRGLRALVSQADVLVENFVPGTLERWGLDEPTLLSWRENLVYCRISGFGQRGPYSDRSALDLIIQGETGLLLTNGSPDAPAKISVSIADIAGSMYAATSILASLLAQDPARSGRSGAQVIDIALFDALLSWSGYFPYMYWYGGRVPGRVGLNHHTMFPYGPYRCRDDRMIVVAAGAGSMKQWRRFCECLEMPELADSELYSTNEARMARKAELQAIVEAAFEKQDSAYWLKRFHAGGVPSGALNDIAEALDHPRVRHRGLVKEVDSYAGAVRVLDFPAEFSGAQTVNRLGPPDVGEHTESVLREFGLTDEEVREVLKAGHTG